MEKSHREILKRLRKNIIDDLDIDNDVLRPLRDEYILKEEDIKFVYMGETKEARAANLLDILPRCGPSAFDVFHQSLKHHYEWLSDEIDILLGNYEIETNGEIDYYAGPPNIPPLSPLTVTREEKLKIALQQLTPAGYIALHGMKGFGKSCLVASTLKDAKLVKDLFSNQIYWIKFTCDRSIDEEILIQLNALYYNVRNLEIQPESFTPLGKDNLIQYLKHYFNKQDNCNALMILDDVYDKKIINTFDFKCKTLVLTADIDVVHNRKPIIIQMNDGFTETETLGLFAKVLEVNINELPTEAKRIHEECKGMPLLIAMFAAQFEEFKFDMSIQPDRWRYYLKSLRKKDATNKVMREFLEKQETIFDICIEQLQPNLRKHYESLAVFCEDVNITPKILEIFWEQNIFQVEELMLDLCHKSLAAKKWNKDLKTYIYGVHDLLLSHLRNKRTPDELIQMHKSIIKKYRKYCNNDFSKLPDDNYIYSYIGYHLEQAQMFEEFPQLYLNFDFIQAKLIHASVNDVLLDLRKYRKYITLDYTDAYVKKISDIERFLQEQARIIVEHKHKKCLDIIQIAMDYPHEGYITQTAKNLAVTKREHLYLSHKKSFQYANMPLTEEISTDICTSSFTDDPDLILTGSTTGKVILWDSKNKHQKIFNGHREGYSIKKIIVSAAGDYFLSLSSDGILKLFSLTINENNEICDQPWDMHVGSPRLKQNSHSFFFTNLDGQDDSLTKFWVENEIIKDMAFGHEDQYIAACTDKATIQIWDRYGKIVFTLRDSKYQYIPKIAFTANASLLHIMDELKGAFVLYSNCGNDYTTYRYLACYNLQLKSAAEEVIFFHHIPKRDNSLMVITKKEAMYVKWWWGEDCVHSFNKQTKGYVDNDAVTYVCATITYDGEYIILADSAGFINVWNTYSGYQPIATYKSRVLSLDSYWLRDEGYHIICGNGNRMLYRWELPVQESDDLPRKCLFDAVVEPYDKMDIVVKESSSKIIVSNGENIIELQFIEGKILNLQLSADGKKAIYVTDHQRIELFDTTTGIIELSGMLDEPIQFVKTINLYNCNMVLCRLKDNNLKIWQHFKSGTDTKVFGIDTKTEAINDVHIINGNHAVAITQNGTITIWHMHNVPWQLISQVNLLNPLSHISFSCLSYNQTYLAILNESCRLTLLYINYDDTAASSTCIEIDERPCFTHIFAQKTTCCDISKNERYIAVGFESGQISIIDIQKQSEINLLSFHANSITQLSWAPVNIDIPILLSLTSDEIVWWNVALAKNNTRRNLKIIRRSRMGITRSISTPSFSTNTFFDPQMSNSRSIDVGVSNLQNDKTSSASITNIVNSTTEYWKNKIGKNPEVPELLAVVELPPSRNPKVCISPDFTKFVTVDMYGSVNTFKLIDYTSSISSID
ncbi:apoptotic protease-activating factor 1 isoform X2 [Monomorium pharaonis]|uniref:apoptotic protease-activating factor 1 isoform X2 n=1 Tax=Monomorium pharaonis TaxID=307658 RepID=UPI00063FD25F|nr:apoptotic protease-activating factor 1 isoform X2 [Monomorium pharaonis]